MLTQCLASLISTRDACVRHQENIEERQSLFTLSVHKIVKPAIYSLNLQTQSKKKKISTQTSRRWRRLTQVLWNHGTRLASCVRREDLRTCLLEFSEGILSFKHWHISFVEYFNYVLFPDTHRVGESSREPRVFINLAPCSIRVL